MQFLKHCVLLRIVDGDKVQKSSNIKLNFYMNYQRQKNKTLLSCQQPVTTLLKSKTKTYRIRENYL
jgi:hypothetical protein